MIFSAFDMPKDGVYTSALPADMTLAVRKTAIDVSAVLTGTIPGPGRPQQVYMRLTLPATMAVADLEVGWDKAPDGWPEAAWIALPLRVDHPRFRLGRLGACEHLLDLAFQLRFDLLRVPVARCGARRWREPWCRRAPPCPA